VKSPPYWSTISVCCPSVKKIAILM
jgi:hypothetical protein